MLTRRHFCRNRVSSASRCDASGYIRTCGSIQIAPAGSAADHAKSQRHAVSLTIGEGLRLSPDQPVKSFGYSAPVLGPVIRMVRGESTDITVENKLSRPTTVHWHGLVIPGAVDGGPHNTIAAGQRWTASLRVDQPESTTWFHPHPHGETAQQVYAGLAGMLLVEDGSGERMGLPRGYGIDDLPLVLQDRVLDRGGAPVYRPGPMDIMAGYRGDTIIVNGAASPVARVPAGLVRLRLLNGANARIFDLRFSDGRLFHVIASDGGSAAPVGLRRR
jgi:blue copper oxidase